MVLNDTILGGAVLMGFWKALGNLNHKLFIANLYAYSFNGLRHSFKLM